MEILIYGLEKGETREYMETLLSTQCRTQAQVDSMIQRARQDGFHSFRIATYNGEAPDFAKAINF